MTGHYLARILGQPTFAHLPANDKFAEAGAHHRDDAVRQRGIAWKAGHPGDARREPEE
jgi:hypothetical protein